ncbi:MAG: hypothetical protein AAB656_01905 [Patescibacteria group bacterium]
MINWNTDEEALKKENPEEYKRWRLTQLINYGLDGEKIDREELLKEWDNIKDRLDIEKKKVFEFFLWGKKWKKEPGLRSDRSNYWQWLLKSNLSAKASI